VASEEKPERPSEKRQRREEAYSIASIGPQISAPIQFLGTQFANLIGLIEKIKADNKITEANQEKRHKENLSRIKRNTRWTIVLSVLSLILSGLTLWILHNQLRSARIEHRAWINITGKFDKIVEGQPLAIRFNLVNSGKTWAKKVGVRVVVEKVKSGESPSFKYSQLHVASFLGILVPNEPRPLTGVWLGREKSSLLNPPILTKADIDEINSGTIYIAMFGIITYSDVYDVPHWTRFCGWHSPVSGEYSARNCTSYNDMDNN
jgi:hypothetical protein